MTCNEFIQISIDADQQITKAIPALKSLRAEDQVAFMADTGLDVDVKIAEYESARKTIATNLSEAHGIFGIKVDA